MPRSKREVTPILDFPQALTTHVLCSGQIITPFNVYFNPRYIYQKMELWRLVTNFLYFGTLGE